MFAPRMKRGNPYVTVLVTAPDMETARLLARTALEGRRAACASLVPELESHYWWQGKLESSAEVLILLKTTRKRVAALRACILEHHPYDTPEFVVLPVTGGSKKYLDWISASVAEEAAPASKV